MLRDGVTNLNSGETLVQCHQEENGSDRVLGAAGAPGDGGFESKAGNEDSGAKGNKKTDSSGTVAKKRRERPKFEE